VSAFLSISLLAEDKFRNKFFEKLDKMAQQKELVSKLYAVHEQLRKTHRESIKKGDEGEWKLEWKKHTDNTKGLQACLFN
jgi:hypothetical protein